MSSKTLTLVRYSDVLRVDLIIYDGLLYTYNG